VLGDAEVAVHLAAFIGGIRLLEACCAAGRARHFQIGKDAVHRGLHVAAGFFHHLAGEAVNFLHEAAAVDFATLHLVQLGFPVAGHGGRAEGLDIHFLAELDQAQAFAGHVEVPAFTGDVFLAQQALDGGGAGGRSAEPAFGHGFTQLIVVDQFARAFHGGEQRGLGVAGRGLGGFIFHFHAIRLGVFALFDGDQLIFGRRDSGDPAIDGQPTGMRQSLAVGQENIRAVVMVDLREPFGDFKFSLGEKDRDEALDHHVVELGFGIGELGDAAGWNDGKVIGDLGVVEDAFVELDPVVLQ